MEHVNFIDAWNFSFALLGWVIGMILPWLLAVGAVAIIIVIVWSISDWIELRKES